MVKPVPSFISLKQSKIILWLDKLQVETLWMHKYIVLLYADDVTSNFTTAFVKSYSIFLRDQISKILQHRLPYFQCNLQHHFFDIERGYEALSSGHKNLCF